jgi:hypothetical protein
VGEDGLAPYHIRGTDAGVNTDGLTITLQPLLYDFECSHKNPLAEHCEECSRTTPRTDVQYFLAAAEKLEGEPISKNTLTAVTDVLADRKVSALEQRKLAKRLNQYWQDSLCRIGESIGAAACLGEPATQAALRTFHFAGKMSFQGSIKRTEQILESPMNADSIDSPRTIIRLRSKNNDLKTAENIASIVRKVTGEDIIKVIKYDVKSAALMVEMNADRISKFKLSPAFVYRQMNTALAGLRDKTVPIIDDFNFDSKQLNLSGPNKIWIKGPSWRSLLHAKEALYNASYSGFHDTPVVSVIPPEKDTSGENRYALDIRNASTTLLNNLTDVLDDLIDVELIETNNIKWIYDKFGLEAALYSITTQLDFQMNGGPGAKGVGEYDWRYVRTVADIMGEGGRVASLAPSGIGSRENLSPLAAASLELQKEAIKAGSAMGNYDPILGIAESIVVGKTARIGDYVPN